MKAFLSGNKARYYNDWGLVNIQFTGEISGWVDSESLDLAAWSAIKGNDNLEVFGVEDTFYLYKFRLGFLQPGIVTPPEINLYPRAFFAFSEKAVWLYRNPIICFKQGFVWSEGAGEIRMHVEEDVDETLLGAVPSKIIRGCDDVQLLTNDDSDTQIRGLQYSAFSFLFDLDPPQSLPFDPKKLPVEGWYQVDQPQQIARSLRAKLVDGPITVARVGHHLVVSGVNLEAKNEVEGPLNESFSKKFLDKTQLAEAFNLGEDLELLPVDGYLFFRAGGKIMRIEC